MITKEMTSAVSNIMVLSVLKSGMSYGYQLLRKIKQDSNELFDWTEGMLYPVLHRLEKQKYIESIWGTSEAGRRRKYYQITSSGQDYLAELLDGWYSISEVLIGLED
ncbi:PadR family transcriptional regulator [Neptunicella marina]|uniref:Helix-turn-helix transcriptional regulator n=1 Tax=Neptunicella marina TaxID=2125989 RepID=A0A8J6IST1_9ALTE|nr:helix-turn-helix transcriptional regulator [Neptunicella marina]MBC3765739.1 helix-turn-helix transcriptional regulator [Neptunicella marina]